MHYRKKRKKDDTLQKNLKQKVVEDNHSSSEKTTNNKRSLESFKIVLVLVVIAFISSLILSVLNIYTKVDESEKIRNAIGKVYDGKLKAVDMHEYEPLRGAKTLAVFKSEDLTDCITVTRSNKSNGIAYGAEGVAVITIISDNKIQGVYSYSHSETPGLGENALKTPHLNQYLGKNINTFDLNVLDAPDIKKELPKMNINRVTSATYSTNAVHLAIKEAINVYKWTTK